MLTPAYLKPQRTLLLTKSLCILIFLATSCTRGGDGIPPPPPPPVDSTLLASFINFGKLVSLRDTLKVVDAKTGNVIINSNPYGVLFGAAVNNMMMSDSLMYQPTATRLLAMNYKTGMVHFTKYFSYVGYSFGGVSSCFPIIEGDRLYQGAIGADGQFRVFCINKTSGETIWEADTPVGPDVEVYLPSMDQTAGNIIINMVDGPASFNKSNGKLAWRNNLSYDYRKLDFHPVVYNDKLFVSKMKDRLVFAFNAQTGDSLWRTELPADLNPFYGKMYAYQDKLYVLSRMKDNFERGFVMHIIDVNTGAITQSRTFTSAQWYIHFYNEYFFCFENINMTFFPQRVSKYQLSTGAKVWSKDLEGGTYVGVIMTPSYIYCTETNPIETSDWQRMNIMDQQNGTILKKFPIYDRVNFSPVLVDSAGKIFYPSR